MEENTTQLFKLGCYTYQGVYSSWKIISILNERNGANFVGKTKKVVQ